MKEILFALILALVLSCPSMASGAPDKAGYPQTLNLEQNFSQDFALVFDLIELLPLLGVDTTYNNGTIFDMIEVSLYSIIEMLANGETEGFFEIPLIQETLSYSNISADDIIISPDEIDDTMPAIIHFQEYQGELN